MQICENSWSYALSRRPQGACVTEPTLSPWLKGRHSRDMVWLGKNLTQEATTWGEATQEATHHLQEATTTPVQKPVPQFLPVRTWPHGSHGSQRPRGWLISRGTAAAFSTPWPHATRPCQLGRASQCSGAGPRAWFLFRDVQECSVLSAKEGKVYRYTKGG